MRRIQTGVIAVCLAAALLSGCAGSSVAAANSALNSFSKELLAQHISTCVADDLRAGSEAKLDELVNLLPKLMK